MCTTDIVGINDVEYECKGPRVYYITNFVDQYHASLGANGTGDGAPLVTRIDSNLTDIVNVRIF